jgi:hypothetical protein
MLSEVAVLPTAGLILNGTEIKKNARHYLHATPTAFAYSGAKSRLAPLIIGRLYG